MNEAFASVQPVGRALHGRALARSSIIAQSGIAQSGIAPSDIARSGGGCGNPTSAVLPAQPSRVTRPVLASMLKRAITDPSAVASEKPI